MTLFHPLVSVVIPTYNRADKLIGTIESVLTQTYSNLEIIIVDDNSDDFYDKELIESISEKVKYYRRNTNGGGAAARNSGIDFASGQYIAFLDDDDSWLPNKIEKQVYSLNKECQASSCGYSFKYKKSFRIETLPVITLDDLKANNKLASTSGLLCSKEILEKERFDETLKRAQDWDLYLRIAKYTNFSYVQDVLYIYDDGDHDRMTNTYSKLTIEQISYRLKMLEKHRELIGESSYKYHVAELVLSALKKHDKRLRIFQLSVKEVGCFYTLKHLFLMLMRKLR